MTFRYAILVIALAGNISRVGAETRVASVDCHDNRLTARCLESDRSHCIHSQLTFWPVAGLRKIVDGHRYLPADAPDGVTASTLWCRSSRKIAFFDVVYDREPAYELETTVRTFTPAGQVIVSKARLDRIYATTHPYGHATLRDRP